MKIRARLLIVAVALLAPSCTSTYPDFRNFKDPRETPEYQAALASGMNIHFVDCPALKFREGRPKLGDDVFSSLDDSQVERLNDLYNCVAISIQTPGFQIGINGFADPSECRKDCQDLSFRRARLVRNVLLKMHFPKDRIACTEGHGGRLPISSTAQFNRRVEIWQNERGGPQHDLCKV